MDKAEGIGKCLGAASAMLRRCVNALGDLHAPDIDRASTAVYLIAVFGRSVTQVIQTIRTYDREHFDEWWKLRQSFMSSDPLLKFFNDVRNQFLKEGGAKSEGGLIGWGNPNGPPGQRWTWHIVGSPTTHKGKKIRPRADYLQGPYPTIETLGYLYIAWLESVFEEAASEFSVPPLQAPDLGGQAPQPPQGTRPPK